MLHVLHFVTGVEAVKQVLRRPKGITDIDVVRPCDDIVNNTTLDLAANWAIEHGLDMMRFLLHECGANPNCSNMHHGRTALFNLSREAGDVRTVRFMLESGGRMSTRRLQGAGTSIVLA